MLWNAKLDPECLPPIEARDLLSYLVLDTSFYTAKQFKAFKSLEAYSRRKVRGHSKGAAFPAYE